MILENIYPVLIIVGCTIGAVLTYLWVQARNTTNFSLALIRMNEELQFDAPAFLQKSWPLLSQAGLRGIAWRLDWFGVPLTFQAGESDRLGMYREIEVAEMKFSATFQQYRRGERRYFDIALIETFLLLLRTDMWVKAGATDATFAQMSKLTLFLEHDMKNVAQFIQLMSDQLSTMPEGKEQQVLHYLRTSAPLIRHRADRIVQALTAGQRHDDPLQTMNLADVLTQICNLYRLEFTIIGAAKILGPENTIEGAFDNILKNYCDIGTRRQELTPHISISITENSDSAVVNISANNVPPVAHIERLFEPFWTLDPAGLGIGLYQAKQMIETCHGSISVSSINDGKLQFHVELPRANQ